mmetsp:Transcript_75558/g.133806  ORF Transcript_75558/g.133806 Transcript_75558/m.133806 type:complete len:248 (-) Transcript_75558:38-781(-)
MASAAWVFTSSFYNKDSDGEMEEGSTEMAWVFPDGLEVGRQVQYFTKKYSASGYPRYGSVTSSDSRTLSIGKVTSIEGNIVNFTWEGAVSQEDDGAWASGSVPTGQLTMQQTQINECDDRGRGTNRRSSSNTAQRQDSYRISAPDAAWLLLPQQSFVATLISHEDAEDDLLFTKLSTLNGDQLGIKLTKDATVGQLTRLVAEERRLGAHAHVHILSAAGAILEQDLVLKSAVESLAAGDCEECDQLG